MRKRHHCDLIYGLFIASHYNLSSTRTSEQAKNEDKQGLNEFREGGGGARSIASRLIRIGCDVLGRAILQRFFFKCFGRQKNKLCFGEDNSGGPVNVVGN